jgi:hypothetical protein
MELSPEKIIIEDYLTDEIIRHKHRRNEDFLKLAITNVNLAKELNLREGLVYDCKDGSYFNIRMPNNEKIFHKNCRYEFPEARLVVVSHYVFLKNNWIEVPVSIDKVVDEIHTTYKPLTENLRCGFIRNGLTTRVYSKKIFKSNKLGNTIKPKYLPVDIEL